MSYPELPWNLVGDGLWIGSLFLMATASVRHLVPAPLKIVSVLPGRTLAAFFFNRFGPGSEVQYHEIAFAPALTRHQRTAGFFTEWMCVDNAEATVGVREASGIRKELAQFSWDRKTRRIEVWQAEQAFCTICYGRPFGSLPAIEFRMPALCILPSCVKQIRGIWSGRLGLIRVRYTFPAGSPLAVLSEGRQITSLCLRDWRARLFQSIRYWPIS